MSSQLTNNVHRMSNPELIGLAKNRWLPQDCQLAIAKFPYSRAKMYLAENPGLHKSTRDYLWSDDCNRGYSLKAVMIASGQYSDEPEKYHEFYDRYPSAWSRSYWRMINAFIGHNWYEKNCGSSNTPADLLNKIYDEKLNPNLKGDALDSHRRHGRYYLRRLAAHQNADLELAIKLSQCGVDDIQKLGFAKIVELS